MLLNESSSLILVSLWVVKHMPFINHKIVLYWLISIDIRAIVGCPYELVALSNHLIMIRSWLEFKEVLSQYLYSLGQIFETKYDLILSILRRTILDAFRQEPNGFGLKEA